MGITGFWSGGARSWSFRLVVLTLLALGGLWSGSSWVGAEEPTRSGAHGTGQPAGPPEPGYVIAVFQGETQVASLSLDALKALPMVEVEIPETGNLQSGPTLLEVLKAAGVSAFSEVTIGGFSKGRIAEAELTLKKDQVTGSCLFDFTKRGTVKLTSPDVPAKDWIVDVNKLVVK